MAAAAVQVQAAPMVLAVRVVLVSRPTLLATLRVVAVAVTAAEVTAVMQAQAQVVRAAIILAVWAGEQATQAAWWGAAVAAHKTQAL
jgi:hypothetical protein